MSKGANNWPWKKKSEPVERIKIQVKPVGRYERSLKKVTPKTDPLSYAKFKRIGYFTYSLQEWNPNNKFGLTMIGQQP